MFQPIGKPLIVNNSKRERQKQYRERNRDKLKHREAERRKRIQSSQSIIGPSTSSNSNIIKVNNEKPVTAISSTLQNKRDRQKRYREKNREKLSQREAERRRRLQNAESIIELHTSPNIENREIITEPINIIDEMPNDIGDHMEHHVNGAVSQFPVKPECIPLTCQPDGRKRTYTPKPPLLLKKQKEIVIDECLEERKEEKTSGVTKRLEIVEISCGTSGDYEEDSTNHAATRCMSCSQEIVGHKYVCVQCTEFELCGSCEASGAHYHHYVLRVPTMKPHEEVALVLVQIRDQLNHTLGEVPQEYVDLGEGNKNNLEYQREWQRKKDLENIVSKEEEEEEERIKRRREIQRACYQRRKGVKENKKKIPNTPEELFQMKLNDSQIESNENNQEYQWCQHKKDLKFVSKEEEEEEKIKRRREIQRAYYLRRKRLKANTQNVPKTPEELFQKEFDDSQIKHQSFCSNETVKIKEEEEDIQSDTEEATDSQQLVCSEITIEEMDIKSELNEIQFDNCLDESFIEFQPEDNVLDTAYKGHQKETQQPEPRPIEDFIIEVKVENVI